MNATTQASGAPADAPPEPADLAAAIAKEPDFFEVEVSGKEALAGGIHLFELRHADGSPLPAFTAGAHLTVEVPGGARRNYSLCSNPAEKDFYQIAVKRDPAGRGGSIGMADNVKQGDKLSVSVPRNNFELHARADQFLFIAGGIGITPILSMMRHLKAQGNDRFKLIYCTRDADSTAFLDILTSPEFAGHVQIHHDYGDLEQAIDFWPIFETPTKAHVYCCGPRGLMDAVADMSGHWPSGAVHFESFGVDASAYAANTAFVVKLAKTGSTVEVGAEQSILDALRAAGLRVPSSCESGTCGSCRTRLIAGEVEHRDMVLSDEEKEDHIMVCVSRAKSSELVLDL
ncbi:MAG: PDR/VanB family oxidoreductase [Variovorax sp.]